METKSEQKRQEDTKVLDCQEAQSSSWRFSTVSTLQSCHVLFNVRWNIKEETEKVEKQNKLFFFLHHVTFQTLQPHIESY